MMRIYVKNSTLVKPAAPTPNGRLWISNVDEVMRSYHATTLYIYRRPTEVTNFFNPVVLKAALSRALVAFYPAAGRLSRDHENDRVEINCNNEGVLFVEAECDGTLDDLGDFTFKAHMNGTLVPVVDHSQGISTYPLVLFQVTRFKCGGVSLGTGIEHHLSDGNSSIHFINTWSDIARGLEIVSTLAAPFIDRTHLRARDPPRPQFDHTEYKPPPPLKIPNSTTETTTMSIFKLTRDQLNSLKARCNNNYSSFEALSGHIWRCACKARGLPEDQETRVRIPVDGRSRLSRHPLPQGYYGNVVFIATHVALSGEVQSKPLIHVVNMIHHSLARMNDDYLRSALDYLEVQPDLSALAPGHHTYRSPTIGINSWARFPVYDADFGWGKPIYMGPGSIQCEGKCIMMQSPTNDGCLLLAVSLPKEHMKLFEKFLYDI